MNSDKAKTGDLTPSGSPVEAESVGETVLHMEREAVREIVRTEAVNTFGVQIGGEPNPLLDKMTPEHVTQVIDNAEADSKRSHARIQFLAVVGSGVFLILCGLFLAYKETGMLKEILTAFVSLAAGWLGGYGYKSSKT